MQISMEQLRDCTQCPVLTASQWVGPLNTAMAKYEINTARRVAAFLAQISKESGGLRRLEENLNYGPQGLANTWPNRYAIDPKAKNKTPNALAQKLARNPEAIANHTYANRMGNGDILSGDGWRYRGRGPKQLTGLENYTEYSKESGFDVVHAPDQLLGPIVGSDSAGWYWFTHGCNELIDADDYRGVTLAINGGLTGYNDGPPGTLTDRIQLHEHAQRVLGVA